MTPIPPLTVRHTTSLTVSETGEAQFMNKGTAPGAIARNALQTIRHLLRVKDD